MRRSGRGATGKPAARQRCRKGVYTVKGTNIARQRDLALAICMSLGLAACGGGGGGSKGGGGGGVVVTPPPVTPPPTTPTTPVTTDPPIDAQLASTNVAAAQAAGFTGLGQTIAIVDSGVMSTHPALAGRVTKNLIYVDP